MIVMSGFDWFNWRKVANIIKDRRVLQEGNKPISIHNSSERA